jgi:hypothetical protein
VHIVEGSEKTTLLWAEERRRGLGDNACVVNGVTDSVWEDGNA